MMKLQLTRIRSWRKIHPNGPVESLSSASMSDAAFEEEEAEESAAPKLRSN